MDIKCEEDLGDEASIEFEVSTFEEFRLDALEFLEDVSERPGDTEDLDLVAAIFSKYRTKFEKRWPGVNESTALDEVETDSSLLQCLEKTSNFVTRLRNRNRNLWTKTGRMKLTSVSKILHCSLRDRVLSQARYGYLPVQYNPETGVAEIRVLHLLIREGNTLKCRIEHASIGSIPFIALSYEWGEPDKLFWIEVSGDNGRGLGTVSLTANLYNALCNLRDSPTVTMRSFWIDQISINQDDVLERGHQVDMMGKIYAAAAQVISYLGPEEASDSEGIRLLDQINDKFGHLYNNSMLNGDLRSTAERFMMHDQIPEELRFRDDVTDSAWQSLAHLVYGPWTRRLWMVQETCLNTAEDDILLLRGTRSFPFTRVAGVEILRFVKLLSTKRLVSDDRRGQASVLQLCWLIRLGMTGRGGRSWWKNLAKLLVFLANAAECSDPRDRVFALLGLAHDAQGLGIVADYNRSYEDVLLDVSVRLMSQELPGVFLQPLEYWSTDNIDNALGLPSWVSRWPSISEAPGPLPLHAAATRWPGLMRFSTDRSCMQLLGIRVACVPQSPLCNKSDLIDSLTTTDLGRLELILVKAKVQLDKYQPNPLAVLLTTIIAGREWSHSEDDFDQAFESLLKLIAIAKHHLHGPTGEQQVELLSLIDSLTQKEQPLARAIIHASCMKGRSIVLADNHRICLAPEHTQAGDIVVAFRGAPLLYVIRPCGNDYHYVGDAYMYGYMNGESTEQDGWENSVEEFSLI